MNEEIRSITSKEKRQWMNEWMNGKMMTLTFFEFYTVYIKNSFSKVI